MNCPECKGTGLSDGVCPRCNGEGAVPIYSEPVYGIGSSKPQGYNSELCPECKGRGKAPCANCHGTGKIED